MASRRPLIPGSENALANFKQQVMAQAGYITTGDNPDGVKFQVAEQQGISLSPLYNGELKTREAGKIGGPIGGLMVREMIKIAEEMLSREDQLTE